MFSHFVKPVAFKPSAGFRAATRISYNVRFFATVEGSTGRQMPTTRVRATPVSHDRATFTIRV